MIGEGYGDEVLATQVIQNLAVSFDVAVCASFWWTFADVERQEIIDDESLRGQQGTQLIFEPKTRQALLE